MLFVDGRILEEFAGLPERQQPSNLPQDQHEPCPRCGRLYYRNYDGTMRRHQCDPLPPRYSRTVTLRSGGAVTLSGTFNPLMFDERERKLLNGLLDAMADYESRSALPASLRPGGEESDA